MKKKLKIFFWILVFCLVAILTVGYFLSKNSPAPLTSGTAEGITISQGTQGSFNDLRIGVLSVSKSEYEDEAGVKQEGLVARLQVRFLNNDSFDQKIDVYSGKKFFVGQYVLTVASVSTNISLGIPGSSSGSVELFVDDARNVRLIDSNLIYASFSSSGLCGNEKGESGGCNARTYLYSSGELLKEYFWYGEDKKNTITTSKKNIDAAELGVIIGKIKDSGVITKDCPSQQIMDASWDYTVNLEGNLKSFHNPSDDCRKEFDKIDLLVN